MPQHVTRLAPSPTGALHLGNARTFLLNWVIARQRGWKIILRIEDLDGPRIKRAADRDLIADLQWLGLDWDQGPVYQSSRLEEYGDAIRRLMNTGYAYPCVCSRKEVESSASAPHAEDGAAVYPGTCRGTYPTLESARQASGKAAAIRFHATGDTIEVHDAFAGDRRYDTVRELGDFVIAKSDGTPSYQLAVVVDDAAMGVTQVVRGDDLLSSTPRQVLLYNALGLSDSVPQYLHLPLIVGPDGRRLAKRHGDTRLSYYRDRGVPAERINALLARWSGVTNTDAGARPADLINSFRLEQVPRHSIVFGPADDAWLLSGKA